MNASPDADSGGGLRPRVEGDRELEILEAAVTVLLEVGYDRLTMDAVAKRANASKATLYRRWESKSRLVIEALLAGKDEHPEVDTGNLRDDLIGTFCGVGTLSDEHQVAILGSVVTAVARDEEFAAAFRSEMIAPKVARMMRVYGRARARGEIRGDADLEVIAPALPGIILHRMFLLGEPPSPDLIARVVDQVILPALTPHP